MGDTIVPIAPITTLFACFLAGFLVFISCRVIALRGNPVFKFLLFGKPVGGESLERAARGHGNFCEYTPIFLILMFAAELHGAAALELYILGAAFTLGRLSHAICFCFMDQNLPLRITGMVLTLFSLIGAIRTNIAGMM